jgi:hypothetical protein
LCPKHLYDLLLLMQKESSKIKIFNDTKKTKKENKTFFRLSDITTEEFKKAEKIFFDFIKKDQNRITSGENSVLETKHTNKIKRCLKNILDTYGDDSEYEKLSSDQSEFK